jgi:hypothetical protein
MPAKKKAAKGKKVKKDKGNGARRNNKIKPAKA